MRCAMWIVAVIAGVLYLTGCADNARTFSGAPGLSVDETLMRPVAAIAVVPEASPTPPGESVAYQVNAQHTGYVPKILRRPLTKLWSVKVGCCPGYPIVADGVVVVAANGKLIGLDATSGKMIWSQKGYGVFGNESGWVGAAYDSGMIFSDPINTYGKLRKVGMYAFDVRTGKVRWSASTPEEGQFSAPPAAYAGAVYTGGAGYGGYVYAFAELTGLRKWYAFVDGGEESSPAVTSSGVYVSYVGPQAYDFSPASGTQVWYYSGPSYGGGGSTPVLYDGLVFVGDSGALPSFDGLVLAADTGKVVRGFNSDFTPAFAEHRGFFITNYGATLKAVEIPGFRQAWAVTLNGDKFETPPLIVGDTAYLRTQSLKLVGYQTSNGAREVQITLGQFGRYQALENRGLGYGSNELVVPDGPALVALKGG